MPDEAELFEGAFSREINPYCDGEEILVGLLISEEPNAGALGAVGTSGGVICVDELPPPKILMLIPMHGRRGYIRTRIGVLGFLRGQSMNAE